MKPISLLLGALLPLSALGASVLQVNSDGLDQPVRISENWEWSDCSEDGDPVKVKNIEVTPDPPQIGKDMTVSVTVDVQDKVEEGAYADVLVKIGVIKLLQKTFDLCEEARNAETDVQCPVEKGEYTIEQTVTLPKEVPRAKFQVSVNAYTGEDEPMGCVDLAVDFRPKFPHIW